MSEQPQRSGDARHAWRDLEAHDLPKRPTAERSHDFAEAHVVFDEAEAQTQASRCIQCPTPNCVTQCPLGSHIQEWMLLTAEGRFGEAAELVREAGALPEICARTCPHDHLCEEGCVLNGPSAAVSIGALEQFLAAYQPAGAQPATRAGTSNGKRVAVVGTGPAALAAADELCRRGYAVEVFGEEVPPSAPLGFGAAPFRLDPSLVDRRWEMLAGAGVVFRSGVHPGESPTLSELQGRFDAVFVGLDARKARPLEVSGRDLEGVIAGEDFLVRAAGPRRAALVGQRVVVIGEDDLAVDCVRAAVRAEASEVVGVVRCSEEAMSAGRREFEDAREEGVHFLFSASPVAVESGPDGRVSGLQVEAAGESTALAADMVVVCLGFDSAPTVLRGDLETLHGEGSVAVPVDERQMTRVRGVFAGGDLVHGPCLVVQAVHDAHVAAQGIDRYLGVV